MSTTEEKLKLVMDITDVVVKRAAEVKEAEKAEKLKIAALKRETAAAAKEDKAAFDFAVKMAKEAEAEEAAAAKRARMAQEREDKAAFDFAVKLARKEAAEKERLAAQLAKAREADFAIRMETATEAVQDQRVHIDALRGRMNLLGEGLGKAGTAAAALGPEFGGLAQGMQKAGSAASAVLTAMSAFGGPVGIALGAALAAASLAWGAHTEKVNANKEALEASNKKAEESSKIYRQLADDLLEADLQQKVLNKTITQTEADVQRAAHGISKDYGPALEDAKKKVDELKVAQNEARDAVLRGGGKKAQDQWTAAGVALDEAYDAYDRLNASVNTLTDTVTGNVKATGEAKTATNDLKTAQADATKGAKDAADAQRALTEELERQVSNLDAAYQAWLRDEQAAADARKQAVEGAALDRQIADEQRERDLAAAARQIKLHDEEMERAEEKREKAIDTTASIANTTSNVADSINSLFEDALDKSTEHVSDLQDQREDALEEGNEALVKSLDKQIAAEKEAAMKQWNTAHKLAIAAAWLDLAASVSKASTAAPWPFNLITMAGAATSGAVNVAKVTNQEPPEFDDTPQLMRAQGGGDRVTGSFKDGDFVAAAQTRQGVIDQAVGNAPGRREPYAERLNRAMVGDTLGLMRTMTRGYLRTT